MVSTGSCAAVRICPNPTGNLIGGNQKSHCAISPAKYVVRDDGYGGRYTGRSSATRALKVRIEHGHSIRSAMTVAGILGQACSSSRIRGSTPSTTDPVDRRRYADGPSAANAAFTVFFEHPTTRDHLDRHPFRPMQPADLSPILHTQHPLPPDLDLRSASRRGTLLCSVKWVRAVLRAGG